MTTESYGDRSSPVALWLDLTPRGPTEVVVGYGICLLVGESNRGAANEAIGMSSAMMADKLYHSGDLKEAIELAFGNACSVVYAYRVLGSGNAKASLDLEDGLSPANTVGTLYAKSEGAWGNGITMKIEYHAYDGTYYDVFVGDGTVGPYDLDVWNLVESATNYVKVNGVAKTIVYTPGELASGKVYANKTDGSLTFYVGEGPAASDQVICSFRYKVLKITITDGVTTKILYNIRDLTDMAAQINSTTLADFVPADGETHLPAIGSDFKLTGGSDGAAITVDDWENALLDAMKYVTPQTVAICDNEVSPGTYDLVGILDGFLRDMASEYKPMCGFVGCDANETIGDLQDLAGGFDNMHLTIVANPWDKNSSPRQNMAVARAAQEAAVALGKACPRIAIGGVNGLLNEYDSPDVVTLTGGRLDVLHKKEGIKSFQGINTATVSQWKRTVDVRTINWCIIMVKTITDQWYFRKNTTKNRAALRASIINQLEDLVRQEIIYDNHSVDVWADTDAAPNKVYIDMGIQPVGHMEIFHVTLEIGPDTE